VLSPPAAGLDAVVTSAAARAGLERHEPGIDQGKVPVTFLATYSYNGGGTVSMPAPGAPYVGLRTVTEWPLVWVFLYIGVLVVPSGPATTAGGTPMPCSPAYEDEVGLVSALTGVAAGLFDSGPDLVASPVPTAQHTLMQP
jgi:hypothetical protein